MTIDIFLTILFFIIITFWFLYTTVSTAVNEICAAIRESSSNGE
jgi:hypothetical protein